MDMTVELASIRERPFELLTAEPQRLPLVVASPHSGRHYPEEFLSMCRLDLSTIRRLEDSFVDHIFRGAHGLGAPFLHALFPRAFIDCNREPYELDPALIDGSLPPHANTRSPRVAAGFGTIARAVSGGREIYRNKIPMATAMERIEAFYRPYHQAMRALIQDTVEAFGHCILLDCHSMPSLNGTLAPRGRGSEKAEGDTLTGLVEAGDASRVDIVLGDLHGHSCATAIIELAEATLTAQGYSVARNNPYAGGYITQHYGQPKKGVHALQIEVNRALYMDENSLEPTPYLSVLRAHMEELIGTLAEVPAQGLAVAR